MLVIFAPLALMQATAIPEAESPAPPPPPKCDSEAHAAFDFWVGEWDVYPNGRDDQIARSTIVRRHNGCAVVEHWQPLRGGGGTSLNHLDPVTGRWHQKWVGQAPGAVEFTGGPVEGKMVLTGYWDGIGGPGVDALVRMTYSLQEDASVRQHGEASSDHGLTWTDSFDLIYRPREE